MKYWSAINRCPFRAFINFFKQVAEVAMGSLELTLEHVLNSNWQRFTYQLLCQWPTCPLISVLKIYTLKALIMPFVSEVRQNLKKNLLNGTCLNPTKLIKLSAVFTIIPRFYQTDSNKKLSWQQDYLMTFTLKARTQSSPFYLSEMCLTSYSLKTFN